MTYSEALDWLEQVGRGGSRLGLDRVRAYLTRLGAPQDQIPTIHVAGTSGKGSVSACLSAILTQAGYRCTIASDGDEGADRVERRRFDLILLDVMLPHTSGFELMEYIRQYDTPVIFLTARTEVRDRVKGLRLGAEDYIIKPFDVAELQARVEVVLRRYHKGGGKVTVGDITADLDSRIVTRGGHPVDLTPKEFDILRLFLQNKNIALYRETIYERVWGEPFMGDTRTVDLHVQRLRHKLGWEKRIAAVYKVGYRYEENEP